MDGRPNYYLVIDGGGTKTEVLLFDERGSVVLHKRGKGSNLNADGKETARYHLTSLLSEFKAETKGGFLKKIFAGMSGGGHEIHQAVYQEIIAAALDVDERRVLIDNDAITALWSGTEGGHGVVIIAGTGSICMAEKPDGERIRIGGWGERISDEGSGYDIGKEALRRVMLAFDGLGPVTLLTDLLLGSYDAVSPPDLIPKLNQQTKRDIAALAPLVAEADSEGDPVAAAILDQAARNLAKLGDRALEKFSTPAAVVLAGGLWQMEGLYKRFLDHVNFETVRPKFPPLFGAVFGIDEMRNNPQTVGKLKQWFEASKKQDINGD